MSTLCWMLIMNPKNIAKYEKQILVIWHIFCNMLLWTTPHFFFFCCHFFLIGLSLFTWHCPSCHRASSQRSHLPNRHIHSLQKCQADKVSNPMTWKVFVSVAFLSEDMSSVCQACFVFWCHCCLPNFQFEVQILQRHAEKIIHPKLLVLEAVYENMFGKCDF